MLGVDAKPYVSDAYETMAALDKLDDVLKSSDVVILALPLTEQTKHLMNADRLSMLKKGSIVVNIARGGVVDTAALIDELRNERLCAVLDVFEDEPLDENSPLWDMDNVMITPHNSFVGDGNHRRMVDVIMKNLETY